MRLATAEQCRLIDARSQAELNLSDELLMEEAASSAFVALRNHFTAELEGPVWIFCGPGNNGGDGYALARMLFAGGFKNIRAILVGKPKGLCEKQMFRAKKLFVPVLNQIPIETPRLIVDAIFGTGLSRIVEGEFSSSIDLINGFSKARVVSLDTPSGLNCDTGQIFGNSVKADMTLTFGLAKPGFFMREGPGRVGRFEVLRLSFSPEVIKATARTHFLMSKKQARKLLPPRRPWSHKSNHGKLNVLAGSEGKWGAAHLCSEAAFRVGAGYVVVLSNSDGREMTSYIPEVMTQTLDAHEFQQTASYAVGPGFGVSPTTAKIIEQLIKVKCKSVVLDADALTVCARESIFPLPSDWLVTPHTGELARLIGETVEEIEADPFRSALMAHEKLGCAVLLKGFHTILCANRKFLVIPTGNSALAKAGTGDVLTGMIGGFIAQGLSPFRAGALAAFVHGLMANEWIKSGNDRRSLIATDLIHHLPRTLRHVSEGLA